MENRPEKNFKWSPKSTQETGMREWEPTSTLRGVCVRACVCFLVFAAY